MGSSRLFCFCRVDGRGGRIATAPLGPRNDKSVDLYGVRYIVQTKSLSFRAKELSVGIRFLYAAAGSDGLPRPVGPRNDRGLYIIPSFRGGA